MTIRLTKKFPRDPKKRPICYHNPPGTRGRGKVPSNPSWPRTRRYVLKARP